MSTALLATELWALARLWVSTPVAVASPMLKLIMLAGGENGFAPRMGLAKGFGVLAPLAEMLAELSWRSWARRIPEIDPRE